LNATLILEFVLPPFDWEKFYQLANTWKNLSTPGGDYAANLRDAINASLLDQACMVRLRLNRETVKGWVLEQWILSPHPPKPQYRPIPAFYPVDLDDQVHDGYVTSKPGTSQHDKYVALWSRIESVSKPKTYPIPADLLQPSIKIVLSSEEYIGMPTPVGLCNANQAVRNLVSLQQCSYCHTSESGTRFVHIVNRGPGKSSILSTFLTGGADSAALGDLYFGKNTAVVNVNYTTYIKRSAGDKLCMVEAPNQTQLRMFNDIARRKLFLAAVAKYSVESSVALTYIQKFSTNFTD
jgi:hypothetical protein